MPRARALLPALTLGLPALWWSGAPLGGQTTCDLVESNYFRTVQGPSGEIVFVSRPSIRCRDGARISADSAEIYGARNFSQFFGKVVFRDSATVLTSERAHFYSREGRLQAWGSVVLTDQEEGSRITGDTLVYLRSTEARPVERVTVTGRRPHATLYPSAVQEDTTAPGIPEGLGARPDSAGRGLSPGTPVQADTARRLAEVGIPARQPPGEPDAPRETPPSGKAEEREDAGGSPTAADTARTPNEVDADRIFLEGKAYFRATGNVELTRDSLEAYADSVEYDERAGRLFLMDSARLLAAGYVLVGRTITLVLPAGEISEIVSRRDAELTGQDLRLTAPEIRLFLTEGRAERLVAVRSAPRADSAAAGKGASEASAEAPPPQPRAVASDFVLSADSIEALTPGEVLERVVSSGRARGESLGRDSLNTPETPEIAQRDWLEGDTVVAIFEPDASAAAADSTEARYRLERVVAIGNARSLYRMEPSDTVRSDGRLAVHFVQGRRISIQLDEGEVSDMEVEGQTRGVYLEPIRRPRPDSAAAVSRPSPSGPPGGRR